MEKIAENVVRRSQCDRAEIRNYRVINVLRCALLVVSRLILMLKNLRLFICRAGDLGRRVHVAVRSVIAAMHQGKQLIIYMDSFLSLHAAPGLFFSFLCLHSLRCRDEVIRSALFSAFICSFAPS